MTLFDVLQSMPMQCPDCQVPLVLMDKEIDLTPQVRRAETAPQPLKVPIEFTCPGCKAEWLARVELGRSLRHMTVNLRIDPPTKGR